MIDVSRETKLLSCGADISGSYRYRLWREWDTSRPGLVMIMLNPSTAGAVDDDPTIRRCIQRAQLLGCGRLDVVNLFAFRATDPQQMLMAVDPIGPFNNGHILDVTRKATGPVICGWGMHGGHRDRDQDVVALLRRHGVKLLHLGLTKTRKPKHPLYIGYNKMPEPLVGPY